MKNHTVRLINEHTNIGLEQLLNSGLEVDAVITQFDNSYFPNGIATNKDIEDFGFKLRILCHQGAHLYFVVNPIDMTKVIEGLTAAGLDYKNMLVIPTTGEHEDTTHECFSTNYLTTAQKYVLFFSNGRTRSMNWTKIMGGEETNQYPANWSTWFCGNNIEMFVALMKIATNHADVVLDPFMSTGDVGVAAIQADRHYIGIEWSHLFRETSIRLEITGE